MGIRGRIDRMKYERDYGRIVRGTQTSTVPRSSQQGRFYLGVATLMFLALAISAEWVEITSGARAIFGTVLAGGLAAGAYLGGKEGWGGRHLGRVRVVALISYLAFLGALGIKLFSEG